MVAAVVRDAALMTVVGIVMGLACGLYLARLLAPLLYDVRPTDAVSMAVPVACLLLTAFLAAVPAARRASRLNPVEALRSE